MKLVTGCFDPLLAGHARRLGEIARSEGALFVAVLDPVQPILPARARAELVAALGVVDYVVLAGEAPDLLERLQPDAVFREEAADARRTQDLLRGIRSRHD